MARCIPTDKVGFRLEIQYLFGHIFDCGEGLSPCTYPSTQKVRTVRRCAAVAVDVFVRMINASFS